VKGRVSKVRDDAEENFFDRIDRIYTINRNRKMKKRLPRRRGELRETLHAFTRCAQHFLILCVFASLREILFRFLRCREGEEENFFDRIDRINGITQGKRLPQRRGELGERLHAFVSCANTFLSFASLRLCVRPSSGC